MLCHTLRSKFGHPVPKQHSTPARDQKWMDGKVAFQKANERENYLKMIGLPSKVGIRTSGCDQSAHTSPAYRHMATSQTSLGVIKPFALLGNVHNDLQGRQIFFSMTGALAGTPITSLPTFSTCRFWPGPTGFLLVWGPLHV
jgi:hypothetical protein